MVAQYCEYTKIDCIYNSSTYAKFKIYQLYLNKSV